MSLSRRNLKRSLSSLESGNNKLQLTEPLANEVKIKRKTCAILMMYSGWGYYGMLRLVVNNNMLFWIVFIWVVLISGYNFTVLRKTYILFDYRRFFIIFLWNCFWFVGNSGKCFRSF